MLIKGYIFTGKRNLTNREMAAQKRMNGSLDESVQMEETRRTRRKNVVS